VCGFEPHLKGKLTHPRWNTLVLEYIDDRTVKCYNILSVFRMYLFMVDACGDNGADREEMMGFEEI
jgi:hypothetical protein